MDEVVGRVVKICIYPDVVKNDEIERRAAVDIFLRLHTD